jgi:hypothetical protein
MNTLRFTKIELRNWKNFVSVDAKLAGRVFIIGPNAIGKSNLLDAFRFLRDLVIDGGGLAKAVALRDGMGKVRSLYARQNTDVTINVEVLDQAKVGWRYELSFTHDSAANARPKVVQETVTRLEPDGTTSSRLSRPDDKDRDDPERLTQTAIQQVTANQNFRELADFLRTVSYLHLVPQLLREEQAPKSGALGPDPYGRDLLDRIRQTTPRSQKARLKRIEKVLQVVAPQLEGLSLELDEHGRPHLQGKFRHWRPQGA